MTKITVTFSFIMLGLNKFSEIARLVEDEMKKLKPRYYKIESIVLDDL